MCYIIYIYTCVRVRARVRFVCGGLPAYFGILIARCRPSLPLLSRLRSLPYLAPPRTPSQPLAPSHARTHTHAYTHNHARTYARTRTSFPILFFHLSLFISHQPTFPFFAFLPSLSGDRKGKKNKRKELATFFIITFLYCLFLFCSYFLLLLFI